MDFAIVALVITVFIAPLLAWNMKTTNQAENKISVIEVEIEALQKAVETCKENDKRIDHLETSNETFHQTFGQIRADLHDIRNFLVRVITKDDPEQINELVNTLWNDRAGT